VDIQDRVREIVNKVRGSKWLEQPWIVGKLGFVWFAHETELRDCRCVFVGIAFCVWRIFHHIAHIDPVCCGKSCRYLPCRRGWSRKSPLNCSTRGRWCDRRLVTTVLRAFAQTIDNRLRGAAFDKDKVAEWTAKISEECLQGCRGLEKPFKFVGVWTRAALLCSTL
jgi:hypothetical protein